MANEIIYSGIGDLTVAATLAATFDLILKDRETGALAHPVIAASEAPMASMGSLVVKVPRVGLMGYDGMAAGTQDGTTALGNTALTDGSSSITLAPREKAYTAQDMARFADSYGILSAEMMAMDLAATCAMDLLGLLVGLANGFSGNVVGTSGAALTNADLLDGVTKAEIAGNTGLLMGMLAPVQVGGLRLDALSLGGAAQHRQDAQGLIRYVGGSYLGNVFGMDLFKVSSCPLSDANVNVNGMIIGAQAVRWALGQFVPEADSNILDLAIPGSPIVGRLERERSGVLGNTTWIQRYIVGVIEGQDAAGVRVRSSAT
jgi:hypothetical protein